MIQRRPTRASVHIDGHRLAYSDLGPANGPVVLFLHGMVSDSSTWLRPAEILSSRGFRTIAPDLLGHGASDKPHWGYSIESFARDANELLARLRIRSATVVGHSYGGAVAMSMAHAYPKRVDRLVLVAAGGLGREVHPVFRAATLPGARTFLRLLVNPQTATVYRRARLHRSLRLSPEVINNLSRAGRGLSTDDGRAAFFATLHTAIKPSGQRGSMLELDYVARDLPTLLVWSERDPVVPVAHAHRTYAHLPNSQLVIFPGSTHQPHHHSAERFADVLAEFVTATPAGGVRG
jgi:pimeloyl-ACP methyl ester carboxylesterase